MPSASEDLYGRDRPMTRLLGVVEDVLGGRRATALVDGEAGIGKSALVRAAANTAAERGADVGWGTCIDVPGPPGYWPWTQAFDGLIRAVGASRARDAIGDDAVALSSIIPSVGAPAVDGGSQRDRLLLMDAASRFLEALAAERPVLLVIDDLQWADASTLELLDFLARAPRPASVGLVVAFRRTELQPEARRRIGGLVAQAASIHLEGLDVEAVHRLLERTVGEGVERAVAESVHHRTGGHPFFARELALLTAAHPEAAGVPEAVRDAIDARVGRLPEATVAVLEAGAVVGARMSPDVLASALGRSVLDVEAAADPAVEAGMLLRVDDGIAFGHDLLREAVLERLDLAGRIDLHRAVARALEARIARGAEVPPAEVARHWVAAVAVEGAAPAVTWSLRAAAADCAALAFTEAAGHLHRARAAVADAGVEVSDGDLTDVLLAEADALSRAGSNQDARDLLRHAGEVARRAADPDRIARVALATAQMGAQFATRRDDVVRGLREALVGVSGSGNGLWVARLTATLARELQHSVAEDRPEAVALSDEAIDLGRRSGDPSTLLFCLLARHDVLWTPGGADRRAEIAQEIITTAVDAGDDERQAEGYLLLANALLEQGSPAFESALDSCLEVLDAGRQPRHRYTAETRRACRALLRGRLDEADALIEAAAELGTRIREPDTGNVRMSQRLELVRARGEPEELRRFAAEALDHWTGAPVHANSVAAGFLARAGDRDGARRHATAVIDLGTWRVDRSYLWSVLVRELAEAAVALEDEGLCRQLFDDVEPLATSCGVNGAVVAFAGSHAEVAARLAEALGDEDRAADLWTEATATYERLDAPGWLAGVRDRADRPARRGPAGAPAASMRRDGPLWELAFGGRQVAVPHSKGLADIARLVASPGAELHVLDLFDAGDRSGAAGEVVDRRALDAYRQRLADLDEDLADAERDNDPVRREQVALQRQALIDELSRVTGTGRRPRQFSNHPAERARKAVSARIRDAIRKLEPTLPELATHLEQAVVTGTYCRYRPDGTHWEVEGSA